MNRIYKVIWSKVKHQYVVTSEFAHSCTKSTGSRVGRSAAAVLAAVVLTMGVGGVFVQAANSPTAEDYVNAGIIPGTVKTPGNHNTAIGDAAWIGGGASNNVAIGNGEGQHGWIGAGRHDSVSINGIVHGSQAVAIGERSWIGPDADGSLALGYGAKVESNTQSGGTDAATNSIAIGHNATVSAEANNSVAFGANSKATEANTFSIGSEGNERKLVNLKDGTEDTDAATYGQVKNLDEKYGNKIGDLQATDQKHDTQISDLQATDKKHDTQIGDLQATDKKHDTQIGDLQATDKKHDTQIGDLQATDKKHDTQIGDLQATDKKHDTQIGDLQATDKKHDTQIGDLQATDKKHDTQISDLQATDKKHDTQISANSAAIAQNRQDINNLNHRVDNLDSRIDKVGAGAAALAALHPLDFDPDAKWDFAAGYGNYNGENAVAVGTFYRPNEDTMFSVGGTFGNGENMINAGVSLKIGAGSSHVTTSRVAMAKEIKSMRDIVAKQDAQIQKLTAMVNALVGTEAITPDTSTMFPDVPENHWAYEAVAAMAKSGLVKGYPDGEFKGDRTMTRYEFAQIVYNAIQAGAEVDSRLVAEFQPELEYFHIATVAKDKDGNPTIERVRAN